MEVGPELVYPEPIKGCLGSATNFRKEPLISPNSGPMIRLQRGQGNIRNSIRHETDD